MFREVRKRAKYQSEARKKIMADRGFDIGNLKGWTLAEITDEILSKLDGRDPTQEDFADLFVRKLEQRNLIKNTQSRTSGRKEEFFRRATASPVSTLWTALGDGRIAAKACVTCSKLSGLPASHFKSDSLSKEWGWDYTNEYELALTLLVPYCDDSIYGKRIFDYYDQCLKEGLIESEALKLNIELMRKFAGQNSSSRYQQEAPCVESKRKSANGSEDSIQEPDFAYCAGCNKKFDLSQLTKIADVLECSHCGKSRLAAQHKKETHSNSKEVRKNRDVETAEPAANHATTADAGSRKLDTLKLTDFFVLAIFILFVGAAVYPIWSEIQLGLNTPQTATPNPISQGQTSNLPNSPVPQDMQLLQEEMQQVSQSDWIDNLFRAFSSGDLLAQVMDVSRMTLADVLLLESRPSSIPEGAIDEMDSVQRWFVTVDNYLYIRLFNVHTAPITEIIFELSQGDCADKQQGTFLKVLFNQPLASNTGAVYYGDLPFNFSDFISTAGSNCGAIALAYSDI